MAGLHSVNLAATTAGEAVLLSIEVSAGQHEFQAAVNLHESTTLHVASGATLTFNNALDLMGNTLTKTGDGSVAINNKLATTGGSVVLQQGTVSGVGSIGGNVNNSGGTISPGDSFGTNSASAVPEPTSVVLLITGSIGLICLGRYRR